MPSSLSMWSLKGCIFCNRRLLSWSQVCSSTSPVIQYSCPSGVLIMISNYFVSTSDQYIHTYIIMVATLVEFFGSLLLFPLNLSTSSDGRSGKFSSMGHGSFEQRVPRKPYLISLPWHPLVRWFQPISIIMPHEQELLWCSSWVSKWILSIFSLWTRRGCFGTSHTNTPQYRLSLCFHSLGYSDDFYFSVTCEIITLPRYILFSSPLFGSTLMPSHKDMLLMLWVFLD